MHQNIQVENNLSSDKERAVLKKRFIMVCMAFSATTASIKEAAVAMKALPMAAMCVVFANSMLPLPVVFGTVRLAAIAFLVLLLASVHDYLSCLLPSMLRLSLAVFTILIEASMVVLALLVFVAPSTAGLPPLMTSVITLPAGITVFVMVAC